MPSLVCRSTVWPRAPTLSPVRQTRRCCCVKTQDCARSFREIGASVKDPDNYAIMPASVQLSDGTILSVIRRGRGVDGPGWLDAYCSMDGGCIWRRIGTVVENTGRGGNPPSLTLLPDGRLYLVYGVRAKPCGIRLKTSSDGGRTWSDEHVVRGDGGLPDLGYVRSVFRPIDGCSVSTISMRG